MSSFSLLNLGASALPVLGEGLSSSSGQSSNPYTIDPSFGDTITTLGAQAGGATQQQATDITNPTDASGNLKSDITGGFSITSNIAAFVIGIICIGGGILMFKQTQTVISLAGKTAATAAKVAA